MIRRLSFFSENIMFGGELDETTYENNSIIFATYAKVSESTLYYVDEYCQKVFMASYNPKISSSQFEKELDYCCWEGLLDQEGLKLLQEINIAIHRYLQFEGKGLGWSFNVTFSLCFKFEKDFRQFTVVGVPVEVVGDKLRSMLFVLRDKREHEFPFWEISYGKNEDRFRYDFAAKEFEKVSKLELTSLELQILRYSGQGFSESEICSKLNLTMPELKNIKYKLFMRLNVKSMPQALFMIYKFGLLVK